MANLNEILLKLIINPRTGKLYEKPVVMRNGETYDAEEIKEAKKAQTPIYPGTQQTTFKKDDKPYTSRALKNFIEVILKNNPNLKEAESDLSKISESLTINEEIYESLMEECTCPWNQVIVFDQVLLENCNVVSLSSLLKTRDRKGQVKHPTDSSNKVKVEELRPNLIMRKLLMAFIEHDKNFREKIMLKAGKDTLMQAIESCLYEKNHAEYLSDPAEILKTSFLLKEPLDKDRIERIYQQKPDLIKAALKKCDLTELKLIFKSDPKKNNLFKLMLEKERAVHLAELIGQEHFKQIVQGSEENIDAFLSCYIKQEEKYPDDIGDFFGPAISEDRKIQLIILISAVKNQAALKSFFNEERFKGFLTAELLFKSPARSKKNLFISLLNNKHLELLETLITESSITAMTEEEAELFLEKYIVNKKKLPPLFNLFLDKFEDRLGKSGFMHPNPQNIKFRLLHYILKHVENFQPEEEKLLIDEMAKLPEYYLSSVEDDNFNNVFHYAAYPGKTAFLELGKPKQLLWTNTLQRTPLHHAVLYDNPKAVDFILSKTKSTDYKEEGGQPLINTALKADKPHSKEIIKKLIQAGFELNRKDDEGLTPLMYAVKKGDYELTSLLLAAGADVKPIDMQSNRILYYALLNPNVKIVQLLIKFGANISLEKIDKKLLPQFEAILKEIKVNGKSDQLKDKKEVIGYLALNSNIFSKNERNPYYKALMAYQFDRDTEFNKATYLKINKNYEKLLSSIIQATEDNLGVIPDQLNSNPHYWNYLLLEQGWPEKAKLSRKELILALVKKSKQEKWLLTKARESRFGKTLLHWAVSNHEIELIEELKQAGFQLEKDFFDDYPQTDAIDNENLLSLIALVIHYGDQVDFNAKNVFGETPLSRAKRLNTFALLMAYGTKPSENLLGLTPIDKITDSNLKKDLSKVFCSDEYPTDIRNMKTDIMLDNLIFFQQKYRKMAYAGWPAFVIQVQLFFKPDKGKLESFLNNLNIFAIDNKDHSIVLSYAKLLYLSKLTYLEEKDKSKKSAFFDLAKEILEKYNVSCSPETKQSSRTICINTQRLVTS